MATVDKKYKSIDFNNDGTISDNEIAAAIRMGGNSRTVAEDYTKSIGRNPTTIPTPKPSGRPTGRVGKKLDELGEKSPAFLSGYDYQVDTGMVVGPLNGEIVQIAWAADGDGGKLSAFNFTQRVNQLYSKYANDSKFKNDLAAWSGNPKVKDPANLEIFYATLAAALQQATAYNYLTAGKAPAGSFGNTLTLKTFIKTKKMDGGAGGASATTTRYSTTITDRKTAWDNFRSMAEQLTGTTPNSKTFNDYYAKLIANQKKYVSKSTSSETSVSNVESSFNESEFATRYIVNHLKVTDDLAGKVGQYQNQINQLIDDSGFKGKIQAKQIAGWIKGMATGKTQDSDINDYLRAKAQVTYSAFADDIKANPNLSIRDVLSSYINQYQNTLEIDNNFDFADVVGKATGQDGKKLSLWDFEKNLRNDKRYAYTKQANQEAVSLAQSFARAFGVNI